MTKRRTANIERLALIAAWLVAAAFCVSFLHGVRWPFPGPADAPTPIAPARQALDPATTIAGRVEVLNATSRAGLARFATERLRAAGFDVVFFGDFEDGDPPDSSVVLDRTGASELADAIARRLGIRPVRTAADSTRYVDVTVVIGGDWDPGRSR